MCDSSQVGLVGRCVCRRVSARAGLPVPVCQPGCRACVCVGASELGSVYDWPLSRSPPLVISGPAAPLQSEEAAAPSARYIERRTARATLIRQPTLCRRVVNMNELNYDLLNISTETVVDVCRYAESAWRSNLVLSPRRPSPEWPRGRLHPAALDLFGIE